MNLALGPIQDKVHFGLQTTKQELGAIQKICFKFRDNGHCSFGLNCRYMHERVYQHCNKSNDCNNCFESTKLHVRSNITSRNFSDINAVNTSNDGFNYFLEDMKSKYPKRYYRNSAAVHHTTTYTDAGLSESSVHASDKSGSSGLACCSAAIEVSAKHVKRKFVEENVGRREMGI